MSTLIGKVLIFRSYGSNITFMFAPAHLIIKRFLYLKKILLVMSVAYLKKHFLPIYN